MTTNSKDIKLYNDFSHLGGLANTIYTIDKQDTQFLEINHPDNFIIKIVVPNGIFEWFIDIFDVDKNKLVSDWNDGYGEPKDILIANRQKAIEEFVQDILNNKLRFTFDKKRFKEISLVEIFKDNTWTELISNSKLKLW